MIVLNLVVENSLGAVCSWFDNDSPVEVLDLHVEDCCGRPVVVTILGSSFSHQSCLTLHLVEIGGASD